MSKLSFLVDVGVGRAVEEALKELGHNVISVADINPGMADADILALARHKGCIVVTMDGDFGEYVYHQHESHQGVLLLRLGDATGPEKAEVVSAIVEEHWHRLPEALAVYHNARLRIRGGKNSSPPH